MTTEFDIVPVAIGSTATPPAWVAMLKLIKVLRLARASRIIKRLTMTWCVWRQLCYSATFTHCHSKRRILSQDAAH